ncbi:MULTISPECIES: LuxR C-terminal-related transcriptional regulator [unclassified Streptomyces]|uniref:LuxR C-terminal-related transcriptional regulator n=1 Tax=unclassified Streptomyces TaxID=2593676 RepID=UPI0036E1283A
MESEDDRPAAAGKADLRAYEAVASGAEADGDALRRLVELRLVEPGADGANAARDPRAAVRDVTEAVRQDLLAAAAALASLPDVGQLVDVYDANRFHGGAASELVPTKKLMNEHIGQAIASARVELLTVQPADPVDRDPAVQARGFQRDRELLDRGARVRYLYAPTALEHTPTVEAVEALIEAGGEVRIGPREHLPPRMILVDRHVFVEQVVVPEEVDAGWHIQDAPSVAWAHLVFNRAWNSATPWERARVRAAEAVSSARQREILRRLAVGDLQHQVGTALGVSEATVNRELTKLRGALGFKSRDQLMAWWGGSEERELP